MNLCESYGDFYQMTRGLLQGRRDSNGDVIGQERTLKFTIIHGRYNFCNEQKEIREGFVTFSSSSVHTNDTRNITTINRHPFFLIIVRSMYIFD